MRKGALGTLATWLAGAGLALAQEKLPAPVEDAPSVPATESAAPATPPASPPLAPPIDTQPWNPPVKDGNRWPYAQNPCKARDLLCCLGDFGFGEFWLRGEYLLWDIKDSHTPALLTTGPVVSGGVLGQPGTQVVVGNQDAGYDILSGGRFTGGLWFNAPGTLGFEGSYFFLGDRSDNTNVGSTGTPLLARPFVNVPTGAQDAFLLAAPGQQIGSFALALPSSLQGAEGNAVFKIVNLPGCRVELLAGFRWMSLDESLRITENVAALTVANTAYSATDRFDAQNNFYGGQIGFRVDYQYRCWFANVRAKLALGGNSEVVDINGGTVLVSGANATLQSGGLLALPTNIGHYSRSEFAVVPEVGVELAYQITSHFRLFAGYTFLYWSDVIRPGDQIDVGLNPAQIPLAPPTPITVAPTRPTFGFRGTDYWAQGANFGVEFRY